MDRRYEFKILKVFDPLACVLIFNTLPSAEILNETEVNVTTS